MGLFDKFKDLFTDEEEVYETKEIEVEDEKENKLPTFMRNKLEKEENKEEEIKLELNLEDNKKEEVAVLLEEPEKPKKEDKFPFNFTDDDFIEPTSRFTRHAIKQEKILDKVQETKEPIVKPYSNKKELDKPKKFRPTPVISPVYGILDKNYTKDDVVKKNEDSYEMQRASKKVDFDAVRNKAYGTSLCDDIKDNMYSDNCELLKEIKIDKKVEKLSEEDLLYNMTVEEKEQEKEDNKDITIEEASDNFYDFGVAYENPPQRSKKSNDEVKIVNHDKEKVVSEKIETKEPVKEEPKNNSSNDLELTDDLFNLIDSMYKERND